MKDSRDEPKLIGSLNLSTEELLYEDCTGGINFPNEVGECRICVYSNEGTIPHFHIIDKNNFECCICIYEAKYFNHGNKQGKLNSKQRKLLNTWMSQPSSVDKSVTNWQVINIAWRIGNDDKYVPKNPKQPNYTDMELYKD